MFYVMHIVFYDFLEMFYRYYNLDYYSYQSRAKTKFASDRVAQTQN